jgi:lipopolysaccharide export system protein LptA
MTEPGIAARRVVALAACATLLLGPGVAVAEKADRDKPIHFSAEQPAEVDFDKRVGTLRGNVVITQGTLTIHADKIDFKQNPDDSLSATAVGKPVSFRQKKDDSDEYFEGYAQRAVYDGQTQTLELFDNALLKQGKDEIHSNYISYNSATNMFRSEGRPNAPGAEGPGPRVQGVFEPRTDTPLGTKAAPKSDGKETTPAGKGKGAAPAKDGKQATPAPAAKAPSPLKLTPDATLQK